MASYEQWLQSISKLNPNLANPDPYYDLYGAYLAGLEPQIYSDGQYHLGSRNPKTGEILKRPGHPTWDLMVKGEEDAGYELYQKDGKWFSRPKSEEGPMADPNISALMSQLGVGSLSGTDTLTTKREEVQGERTQLLDKLASDVNTSPEEAAMRLFVSSLPALVGGAIGGGRAAGIGASAGSDMLKQFGLMDQLERKRDLELGTLKYESLGDQLKTIDSQIAAGRKEKSDMRNKAIDYAIDSTIQDAKFQEQARQKILDRENSLEAARIRAAGGGGANPINEATALMTIKNIEERIGRPLREDERKKVFAQNLAETKVQTTSYDAWGKQDRTEKTIKSREQLAKEKYEWQDLDREDRQEFALDKLSREQKFDERIWTDKKAHAKDMASMKFGFNLTEKLVGENVKLENAKQLEKFKQDFKMKYAKATRESFGDKLASQTLDQTADAAANLTMAKTLITDLQEFAFEDNVTFRAKGMLSTTKEGKMMARLRKFAADMVKSDQGSRPSDFDIKTYQKMISGDWTGNAKDIQELLAFTSSAITEKHVTKLQILRDYGDVTSSTEMYGQLADRLSGNAARPNPSPAPTPAMGGGSLSERIQRIKRSRGEK